jgi:hypothetical protein
MSWNNEHTSTNNYELLGQGTNRLIFDEEARLQTLTDVVEH